MSVHLESLACGHGYFFFGRMRVFGLDVLMLFGALEVALVGEVADVAVMGVEGVAVDVEVRSSVFGIDNGGRLDCIGGSGEIIGCMFA